MNIEVEYTLFNLEQMERTGKELPAKDEFKIRLLELTEGRKVPIPIFNCLDFSWRPSKKKGYPQSVVSCNTNLSICKFYQDDIGIVKLELEILGTPDVKVVVPDSELLDSRIFSFAQSREERIAIAQNSRISLADQITELGNPTEVVILWSEFCEQQGLKTPLDYTSENYARIKSDPKLQRKVKDQVRDSRKYMERNGVSLEGVREDVVFDRTAWYLAMYMGEGQALYESRAICLNLEDRRVPTWFQIGANGKLPILTPVNPNVFYTWRKSVVGEGKL